MNTQIIDMPNSDIKQRLADLSEKIKCCNKCPDGRDLIPVPGKGLGSKRIMFIGHAPNTLAHKRGEPFVGEPSGSNLYKGLSLLELTLDEVYITNYYKCYVMVKEKRTLKQDYFGLSRSYSG